MKVHYISDKSNLDSLNSIKNPILTIGTFDGVHLGHQKIIKKLNEVAQKKGGESVLFTFFPHPRHVLSKNSGDFNDDLKMLQTQEEKIEKLERMGLDHLIVFPFTLEFANIKAEAFVKDFLVDKLHVNTIIVGYDHQFGKNREGSLEHLMKLSEIYPFEVIEISAHEIDEVNISSTKIRKALQKGDIATANAYLNEDFEISGKVIKGRQLGRTIGFPTANIEIQDTHKLIPAFGVYAVKVKLENGEIHFGMMNIGVNPTVTDENKIHCEVAILDFSADIYETKISVYLLKRIRDEKKFNGLEALKTQIQADEREIRSFLLPS